MAASIMAAGADPRKQGLSSRALVDAVFPRIARRGGVGRGGGGYGDDSGTRDIVRTMAAVRTLYGEQGQEASTSFLRSMINTGAYEGGGNLRDNKMNQRINHEMAKTVGRAIGVGIMQGLPQSRHLEVAQGLASLAGRTPIGLQYNADAALAGVALLSKAGPEFKGARGVEAYGILSQLAAGKGGGSSRVTAMLAAGLGEGKGFFDTMESMQGALSGDPKAIRRMIDQSRKMYGHDPYRQYMMSEQWTGGAITMAGFRRIEAAYGKSGGDKLVEAEIAAAMKEGRGLQGRMADDIRDNSLTFKRVENVVKSLLEVIGNVIAPLVNKVVVYMAGTAVPGLLKWMGITGDYKAAATQAISQDRELDPADYPDADRAAIEAYNEHVRTGYAGSREMAKYRSRDAALGRASMSASAAGGQLAAAGGSTQVVQNVTIMVDGQVTARRSQSDSLYPTGAGILNQAASAKATATVVP
jgi:hypothetical protein